jgi:hypothetical protein
MITSEEKKNEKREKSVGIVRVSVSKPNAKKVQQDEPIIH